MSMAGERAAWESDPEFLAEYARQYPFEPVADEILKLRAELGWTQSDLAARLGTTQSVVARAESGRHSFQISFLNRIAAAAKVTWRPLFVPTDSEEGNITVLANVVSASLSNYIVTAGPDDLSEATALPVNIKAAG
jgi:transcriptional regulator with XRE-family HTH domain